MSPASDGVRATMYLTDDKVTIAMADGELFSYALWQVCGRPYDSGTVVLDIRDEDDLYFAADDPLTFSAVGLPQFSHDGTPPAEAPADQTVPPRTSARWRLPVLGISARTSEPERVQRVPVRRKQRGAPCVHEWRTLHVSGLVRSVCNHCKTVSLDLTE